jgi:DNA helicase MCM9
MEDPERRCMDLTEMYDRDPEGTLSLLDKARAPELFSCMLRSIPISLEISHFLGSPDFGRVVTVKGTVLRVSRVKFREADGRKIDHQEVRIQERSGLHIPQNITAVLEGRNVDLCRPGEEVRITGIVSVKWGNVRQGAPPKCEFIIRALEVLKTREEAAEEEKCTGESEFERRKRMVSLFCETIHGRSMVKFSLLLSLIGGVDRDDASVRRRGTSHVLLVGPPATGKSRLMAFCAKVVSPSAQTTGVGCSSAGLTVCAVREGGEWGVEAGALVLADKGLCLIDEFAELKKEDKASLLEAMEQQSITVAKAGIMMRLESRCTLVASCLSKAGSPRSLEALKIEAPLASRFDLVIWMDDARDEDMYVAEKILGSTDEEYGALCVKKTIAVAKEIEPVLCEDTMRVIKAFYEKVKDQETTRFLESHIRLVEAHARLMGRRETTEEDGLITAILLEKRVDLSRKWGVREEMVICDESVLKRELERVKREIGL